MSTRAAVWVRDLALGVRLAASGGREGWARTALTALGVGLGVALLLIASSVPHILDDRTARADARMTPAEVTDRDAPRSDASFLWLDASTEYRGDDVSGDLLRGEGPHAPAPPGVHALPGPGEMVVSAELRDRLAGSGGTLLRQRLPYRIVGTIAPSGLLDPGELRFYAGDGSLGTHQGAHRSASYGAHPRTRRFSPVLVVLTALIFVVLLVPVGVFIATAVRFGGERRDRRLAALRLVGADRRMTRRVAAGEALFGALLGLAVGAVLFVVGSRFAGAVRLWGESAFPSDVVPVPALAVVVALAVPAAAVAVTMLALRAVSIEPLGVVRRAGLRRRRLWWRLVLPAAGIAVLTTADTVTKDAQNVDPYPVAAGAVLVLIGLVGLLPWLVETSVARLRGGLVPWQLAIRRLQLGSGTAAQAVGGITVAVAGAIALQMMFGGVQEDFAHPTGSAGSAPTAAHGGSGQRQPDATVQVGYADGELAVRMADGFRRTEGVAAATATVTSSVTAPGPLPAGESFPPTTTLTVGDCASLRILAHLPSCHDGDTFVALPAETALGKWIARTARPGKAVDLLGGSASKHPELWTLPASTRTVRGATGELGFLHEGILATPGAIAPDRLHGTDTRTSSEIWYDTRVPDAVEHIRTTAARMEPVSQVITAKNTQRDKQYAGVQTGLEVGGTAVMALIAASLLVSQVEQLRERRRLLSVLVAFGTRRRTLAWSVLWQTAVPVLVGTLLAVAGGVVLGRVMLGIVAKPVKDWWVFWPYAGAGAAVVLAVTLASMPALWRLMRADGLRTE